METNATRPTFSARDNAEDALVAAGNAAAAAHEASLLAAGFVRCANGTNVKNYVSPDGVPVKVYGGQDSSVDYSV